MRVTCPSGKDSRSRATEEYIPPDGGARRGGTYVDATATNGTQTVRIQTVDVDAAGNPTPREAAAAARIRARFPNDQLILVPKN
jgi:filamentous hemagglutinin